MSGSPVVRSQTIDLPAGRFHYLSWGAERDDRPAMVLLHGITSSALSWVRVGPALATRYRVYALDMRGHGESIKPPAGAYSLRHTADDAAGFIEALGLDNPAVKWHSRGHPQNSPQSIRCIYAGSQRFSVIGCQGDRKGRPYHTRRKS